MRIPLSAPASAFVAAIVGFGGTVALVIAAAGAVGATQAETASWITAMCLALVVESAAMSWRYRMPVVAAWSTPGAALIAASEGFTMADTVGAFLIAAVLLVATGLIPAFTRVVSRIPASVASGMLAGIVVAFVTGAFAAVPGDLALLLPLAALFFAARLVNPMLSVLAVLVVGVAAAFLFGRAEAAPAPALSGLVLVAPSFSLQATIGLAIPLYLVTMASQNLSGLAVLRAAGYAPPAGPVVAFTGLMSALSAPFGALTTNLAAISAAICTGPDAHPDPARRWIVGLFYAGCYFVLALFGASLVAVFAVLPAGLIALVAGLGLMGALANALVIAFAEEGERFAALTAFAVTASGITLAGIGSAFWGLAAGLAVLALERLRARP